MDASENLRTTYSYDAFGQPTTTYHSGQVDCMYRFTGRVYDGAMGNYFYRARYYNQSLGRFFSRDPIFSLTSLYAYCHNSPANFTDPFGQLADNLIGRSSIASDVISASTSGPGRGPTIFGDRLPEEPVLPLPPDRPPYIAQADLNNDGEVSVDEYVQYMAKSVAGDLAKCIDDCAIKCQGNGGCLAKCKTDCYNEFGRCEDS